MNQTSPTARFRVVLGWERGLEENQAAEVAALFDRYSGPVSVALMAGPVRLKKEDPNGSLRWSDLFAELCEMRERSSIPPETFVFLLTKTPNEHNWYAAEDPRNMRNGFGHVSDFSWATSAPDCAIASHYLLKAIFNALVEEAGIEWQSMWHEKPRGCFYDFCQQKGDLAFKLRTADICGDCLSVFRSIAIPDSLLNQTVTIMEAMRRQAINTGQFLPGDLSFDAWPFPVAITRHKAVQASNPLLRFLLLLDHFDSLVRYCFLAHEIIAGHRPSIVERPSLGWWVDQLAHCLKGERHFRQVVAIAQEERVVNLRNEKRGHGWMSASEDAYCAEAESLENVLMLIETELRPFLQRYRMLIPRQFHLEDGRFTVKGDQLIGSHILHPPFEQRFDSDPRTAGLSQENRVYLTDVTMDHFYRAAPYFRFENCPSCNHPRLLITDGGVQYIDALMGHRVTLPARHQ